MAIDLKGGVAIERLRDRWDEIAPRERKLVVLLGVTFLVCVVGWVAITVSKGLGAIEGRNRTARAALAALEAQRDKGGIPGATPDVVIPPEPLDLSTYVDEIVREVKAQSPAYPSPKQVPHGELMESTMRLSFKALTMDQTKDLLEKLESKSALVVTRELKVKKSFSDREKLDVDLSISTYHRPAEGGKDDDGPAGGKAPAAGGAPSKEPS